MCSKIAEAAVLVPALVRGLSSYCDPPQGLRLDTVFALRCAAQVRLFKVSRTIFDLQGLAAFLAAAKQLTDVRMTCTSMLQAAQAGFLLGQCSAVRVLTLSGACMPAGLPTTVTELTANFSSPADCGCTAAQPAALIYHAALLPNLATLRLRLPHGKSRSSFPLQSPIQLHYLETLEIGVIRVSEPEVDLSWVQRQPCRSLTLRIEVDTSDVAKHAAIVKQLHRLVLSNLTMEVLVPSLPELQALWHGLTVDKVELETAAAALEPLQMVPQCSELVWQYFSEGVTPLHLSWQNLTSRAARIQLYMMDGELHVAGASSRAPHHLGQPWQLEIYSAGAVHGLPASQPDKRCKYFLQNAAARAAGWTTHM